MKLKNRKARRKINAMNNTKTLPFRPTSQLRPRSLSKQSETTVFFIWHTPVKMVSRSDLHNGDMDVRIKLYLASDNGVSSYREKHVRNPVMVVVLFSNPLNSIEYAIYRNNFRNY